MGQKEVVKYENVEGKGTEDLHNEKSIINI